MADSSTPMSERNMQVRPAAFLLTALALLAASHPAQQPPGSAEDEAWEASRWSLRLEGGAFWMARNDVQVPGDSGTRFDMLDVVGTDASAFGRVHLDWRVSRRHALRLVYAPVRASGTGLLTQPVDFDGVSFPAGSTYGRYRFDTYRLTWRYLFRETPSWRFHAGLTGLVRDAALTLEQPGLSARKANTGFVPLIHLDGRWDFAPRWDATGDLDFAAASQGRAIDLSLEVGYRFTDRWRSSLGYRTIEGGADNDEVFSFAWLSAATLALTYGF